MKNLTEIVCVLDRSGSMATIVDDAIGGFNTFLKSQKETPGEAVMSVVLFDDQYEMLHEGKPLAAIPPLNHHTFVPRGSTALYDAIGRTMNAVGARLARLREEERPNKVLFVILTDGMENASQYFTNQQIHQMISHQRDVYSWEFVYLAANQDAFAVSEGLGISRGNTMQFEATTRGTLRLYKAMGAVTSFYRSADKSAYQAGNLFGHASGGEDEDTSASRSVPPKKKRVRRRIRIKSHA